MEEEEIVGNENEWGMLQQKMQVQGILANTMDVKSRVVVAVGTSALNPGDLKCLALIMH